jgi:dTDP-4-amino-4,6-dideoxygalactose transaminase
MAPLLPSGPPSTGVRRARATPELAVTEALASEILSIPFHARLTDDDLVDIATTIRRAR